MKVLVDTCGWIEWLTKGALLDRFAPYFKKTENLIVPTIIQFELYKWICRERDEATALNIVGITEECEVRPLDTSLALYAADIGRQYKLAMADAIIYAASLQFNAKLVTSDGHFKNLPEVTYFSKSKD